MEISRRIALVVVVVVLAPNVAAHGSDGNAFDAAGLRVVVRVLDDCVNSDGFAPCLKRKALTFVNRLSRMDKLPLTDDIVVYKSTSDVNSTHEVPDNRSESLDRALIERIASYVKSRTLQVTMPRLSELMEEGRGKKMKGMMSGMMMGMATKMMGMIPLAIAGLFLLAGKALITSKIALMLAGIIAIKKLVAAKSGGGGHGGGWQSGGGGWHGSSGGGWDRRALDSQKLAYNAYAPTN